MGVDPSPKVGAFSSFANRRLGGGRQKRRQTFPLHGVEAIIGMGEGSKERGIPSPLEIFLELNALRCDLVQ